MRLPLLVILLACCTVSLSGCRIMSFFNFIGGPNDPELHRVGGGADPAGAAATGGRAFKGRAVGELAGPARIKHGFVKSRMKNVRFAGSFTSQLTGAPQPGDDALGPLAAAQWHGRFTAVRNRATGKFTIQGLVLARFDDETAGRACVQLKYQGIRKQNRHQKKAGLSKLSVLGGEGGARTLRGTGRVRAKFARGFNGVQLRGKVKTRRGAERGLPKQCRKLRNKFGLAPL